MKVTMEDLQTETIKLSPKRIFSCKHERRMMGRKDVTKDHRGDYHCSSCGGRVEDVTNTETGQSLIQILAL